MLKPHYVYSKEGASLAMGLTEKSDINYYIKKAKKLGIENMSKIIGGIEYFDIDMLENPKLYINDKLIILFGKSKNGQLFFKF